MLQQTLGHLDDVPLTDQSDDQSQVLGTSPPRLSEHPR